MVKTFKEYYADPTFKEKHQKYMLESVVCECGCNVMRSNLSKHKKTTKHAKKMEKQTRELDEATYQRLLSKIKEDLKI
jgi:hypothetical protein